MNKMYNSDNIKILGGVVPVFRRALLFPTRVALQDDIGIYTYAGLHQAASTLSKEIAAQLCKYGEFLHNGAFVSLSYIFIYFLLWKEEWPVYNYCCGRTAVILISLEKWLHPFTSLTG